MNTEVQKNELNVLRLELELDSYNVEEGLSTCQLLRKKFHLASEAATEEKQEGVKEMKTAAAKRSDPICRTLCYTLLHTYWQYSKLLASVRAKRTRSESHENEVTKIEKSSLN